MARPNLITQYMTAPLPTPSAQRRLPFRPTPDEARNLYRAINKHIFDNQLTMPDIVLKSNLRKVWGGCYWEDIKLKNGKPGTWCKIELMDKWFCPQWFCNTLAHEMVHQYQWDIERFDGEYNIRTGGGAHGPSFHAWKQPMADWGMFLKTSHGMKRWLKHQDFRKC